jgi:hypothetical protein
MTVTSIGFGKSLPGHPDSNFMLRIKFDEEPPAGVVQALTNVLRGSYPMGQDQGGKRLTFHTNGMNGENKITLAKQALHRVGYQKFPEAFGGRWDFLSDAEWQERLDELFAGLANVWGLDKAASYMRAHVTKDFFYPLRSREE